MSHNCEKIVRKRCSFQSALSLKKKSRSSEVTFKARSVAEMEMLKSVSTSGGPKQKLTSCFFFDEVSHKSIKKLLIHLKCLKLVIKFFQCDVDLGSGAPGCRPPEPGAGFESLPLAIGDRQLRRCHLRSPRHPGQQRRHGLRVQRGEQEESRRHHVHLP